MKIIFIYKTQQIIGSQKMKHPGKQILFLFVKDKLRIMLINFIPRWTVPGLFW